MGSSAISYELARRADELLGDGEWHSYEQTVRQLVRVIPPGVAMRRSERLRIKGAGGPVERVRPRPTEAQIATGARQLVIEFLRNRSYETDRPSRTAYDPDRQIRITGKHRALTGDRYRALRDQLQYENQVLRDQRDALVSYLKDHGQAAAVDQLLGGGQHEGPA